MQKNLTSIASPVPQPHEGAASPAQAPAEIDPEDLAKEVFKLLREDLRRERERQGRQAHLGKETV